MRFPSDHPNAWVVHLSTAMTYRQQGMDQQSLEEMESCLNVAKMRYESSNITIMKVKLQYAKALKQAN